MTALVSSASQRRGEGRRSQKQRVSACLRTCETHALKEAVGDLKIVPNYGHAQAKGVWGTFLHRHKKTVSIHTLLATHNFAMYILWYEKTVVQSISS
jgi:hypothetical protein